MDKVFSLSQGYKRETYSILEFVAYGKLFDL